jgi:hypothetical protein
LEVAVVMPEKPAAPSTDAAYEGPEDFLSLERRASGPAEELLNGFLVELGQFDTETLLSIADYRDAIRPDGWLQRCIREYVEVWR